MKKVVFLMLLSLLSCKPKSIFDNIPNRKRKSYTIITDCTQIKEVNQNSLHYINKTGKDWKEDSIAIHSWRFF